MLVLILFQPPQELFDKIKDKLPQTIDMETSALYQIGWLLNVRVLAIRGVSNQLNSDGTDDKIHQSDLKGSAEAAARVTLGIIDSLILKYNPSHSKETIMNIENEVTTLIKQFSLQPHPEGGYYARTFQSKNLVKSLDEKRYNNQMRNAGTAIYYLLKGSDFSAWHRLKSDEMWHFYKGSAIKLYIINQAGELSESILSNNPSQVNSSFQICITAGDWFAAELIDKTSFSFVGCTVTPGFEFEDFELADRAKLVRQYPQHSSLIKQLTRIESNDHELVKPIKIFSKL